MSPGTAQLRLQKTRAEYDTHLEMMAYAHAKVRNIVPVTADTVQTLSDEQVAALDQYIYRFTKWQDTLGARAFDQCLQMLAEDSDAMAFIDKLNRLEKLGALPSAAQWLELRALRNVLAHEYSENAEELAEAINTLYEEFPSIREISAALDGYIAPYLAGT